MATNSRQLIMARRATAVADLTTMSLTNGDCDLDQAFNAGLFRANCTHQIGLATTTEVGLTPERFPVRVVLVNNVDEFPVHASETVCSYWRIRTYVGAPVTYSRKPNVDNTAIGNLYDIVQDIDSMLWDHYNSTRNMNLQERRSPAMDEATNSIYAITCIQNPAQAQEKLVSDALAVLLSRSIIENNVPYIRIGENAYMEAVPHGKPYRAVGTIPADRAAMVETIIGICVNNQRFKARYPAMDEGLVTLSAYATASMFRHGLQESYESEEYHTLLMTPDAAAPTTFRVAKVISPRGVAAPTDLAVGQVVDIGAVKLRKQLVELSTLLVMSSGIMHYTLNHTTGGTLISGPMLTILSMHKLISSTMPENVQTDLTSLLYEALHPSNKRAIADLMIQNSNVITHGRSSTAPRYDRFEYDSFASIRSRAFPAGSHKAYICAQALGRVLASGLAPFLPWAGEINTVIGLCEDILNSGAKAHIGAHYYTGDAPGIQPASLDKYLPELAEYVHIFSRGDTLAMSPHLSAAIAQKTNLSWSNMLKDLRAKDISGAPTDVVKRFLETSGVVHFTLDASDETTWAGAAAEARLAKERIDGIFD